MAKNTEKQLQKWLLLVLLQLETVKFSCVLSLSHVSN